jgi:class 3 adenylate cyclase
MDELLFRLIPMYGELYLVGINRVYRYVEDESTFLPLTHDLTAEILSGADVIVPDESDGYWIVQHEGKYSSSVIHTGGVDSDEQDIRTFPVLQNLGEIIGLSVKENVLFITGKDKISLFDLSELDSYLGEIPFRIEKLNSQETGELNLDLPSSMSWFSEEGEIILSHSSNTLGFYLAGLEFQSVPEPMFRYMMNPIQKSWSDWGRNRTVNFPNLKHGDYLFKAQAKDLYGRVSNTRELKITIRPPFYLKWYAFVVYGVLLLVGVFLFQKWRLLSYQRAESRVSQRLQTKLDNLTVEKEKSDKLVAEILPERTAEQLRSKGKARWDKYERATVLFSDIQGFTRIAEEMNPESLIDELDKFFFHFDSVVEKYNIEKIKTIGDAYMAAGGIPEKNSTNPVEVVLAALEMQSYMEQLKSSKADIWDLRIGIHTGPVIAGVVGHKKISYDIWGDTVNTASRMESSGAPGKVNISGITYGMVKDYFICEYRGKLPVKYKGNIDMYFVNGLRPELSVDLKGLPNKRFFTKLQLLRLGDLEEKVFETILSELPPTLYFHKLEYAQRVFSQAFLLCRAEEIEQEERLLVRTAALLLFTGLTQSFNNYENRSSVIAREILPEFEYSESQIDQICNLILSTKQPFNPTNRLEKILIDAKMEFIGRPDYSTQIKLLYQELKEAGSKINGQQFKKQQLELLYNFNFYTMAAQRLREVSGADQMETLEQERWI